MCSSSPEELAVLSVDTNDTAPRPVFARLLGRERGGEGRGSEGAPQRYPTVAMWSRAARSVVVAPRSSQGDRPSHYPWQPHLTSPLLTLTHLYSPPLTSTRSPLGASPRGDQRKDGGRGVAWRGVAWRSVARGEHYGRREPPGVRGDGDAFVNWPL